MAKKIILAHTSGNEYYEMMQVLSTTANEPVVPGSVNLPVNTGIIDPKMEADPELSAYLNGSAKVILCNIDTPDPTENLPDLVTSESWFTLLTPNATGNWVYGHQDFHLVRVVVEEEETVEVPVCGNPHGVVRVGDSLVFNNFDYPILYRAPISAFESPAGSGTGSGNVVATEILLTILGQAVYGGYHGVSLIAKTHDGVTDVFALYIDGPSGENYGPSKLVRARFNSSGAVTDQQAVTLGMNAIALDFAGDAILVTVIGGYQHNGSTNGVNSSLQVVTNVFASTFAQTNVRTLLTGDGEIEIETNTEETLIPISLDGNYDIRAFVASPNGGAVYLLCQSFDNHYHAYWRLFLVNGTIATVLACTNKSIGEAVAEGILSQVDSGYGAFGNNWDLYFDNTHGMLIFSQGSKLRFSTEGNYNNFRLFEEGALYDFSAVPPTENPPANINVNSVLPLADLMALAEQGTFKDNRLHKAHHAMRMAAKAAKAAAAPAEEEEEEEGKSKE
jgi:hypothetical protein